MSSMTSTLRAAFEKAINGKKASERRKAVTETIPKIVDELTKLAAMGGTRRLQPKEINAACTAVMRVAGTIRITEARDFDALKTREDFTLSIEKAVRALDDCEMAALAPSPAEAENELDITRRHNASAMDALSALKGALGDRVVPVMKSHGTRGSDA